MSDATDSTEPTGTMPGAPGPAAVLPHALAVMGPLVTWLLRSGVSYGEFVTALKPIFLKAAQQELAHIGARQTDSALSLLSGLHRKDVKALAAVLDEPDPLARLGKPSPASQVVTRWLSSGLPSALPLQGEAPSFEALARAVSTDVHPRSVLQELLRLGVVEEEAGQVSLRQQAFVPDARHVEARQLMSGSVADHLAAGVHNLSSGADKTYLEQSVFADGLSEASARQLELLANTLWQEVLTRMVQAAVPLCAQDEPAEGNLRIRLGMFCYSAPMGVDEKGATGRAPSGNSGNESDNTSEAGQ